MTKLVDITPSPRVLRTLGEIPFQPWQCMAELVDNSIDAFAHAEEMGMSLPQKRIVISWSNEYVPPEDRVIEIVDTGPGMSFSALQDSVRAGYTSNDPMNNLGLFGMGFNIATARLGDRTQVLTALPGSTEWVGVEIDFAMLTASEKFEVPVIRIPKRNPSESGTKIIISKLKQNMWAQLRSSGAQLRRTLGDIYTPILLKNPDLQIMVQSQLLSPRRYCIWGEDRFVVHGGDTVPAVIPINENLGEAHFDVVRNRYLYPEEITSSTLPPEIVIRKKGIYGWIGIQRYPHPDDFGIDFIRNGRKILIRDKSLFFYENPLTGNKELEYPVELGSTVGGRIVGEIHIDHIPPNYQKTDFDRTDPSWSQVVEFLRGIGPILPKKRKALGYTDANRSPLGLLVNAYRRADSGTKYLGVPPVQAREWAQRFYQGEKDYQTDAKWWAAAQEADRNRADAGASNKPSVDPGEAPSDDPSAYGPGQTETPPGSSSTVRGMGADAGPAAGKSNKISELKTRSTKLEIPSGPYAYEGCPAPFHVTVWEVTEGSIGIGQEDVPCLFHSEGNTCDFFFNPRHAFLVEFRTTYRELLLIHLAEKFKVRDNLPDISPIYVSMVRQHFPEARIDHSRIQEVAKLFFEDLRVRAMDLLSVREGEVIDCIMQSAGEVEETQAALLLSAPDLLQRFQDRQPGMIGVLAFAPARTLIRLVDQFPEELFDGKLFKTPYLGISGMDDKATERLRAMAKERVLAYMKDALWVITELQWTTSNQRKKDELARCAHSLAFLQEETV